MSSTDSPLVPLRVLTSACSTDHGGCLGKCEADGLVPFRYYDIDIPRSLADALLGYRFHLAGDPTCECRKYGMHYVIRDYDCHIAQSGHNLEAVLLRFLADVVEMDARIKSIPVTA